jgi:hypothetical protein
MQKQSATQDAKDEFKELKKRLPRGWIRLWISKKYGKKGELILSDSRKLESFLSGNSAPTKSEMNSIASLILNND